MPTTFRCFSWLFSELLRVHKNNVGIPCKSEAETRPLLAGSLAQVQLLVNYNLGSESLIAGTSQKSLGEDRVDFAACERNPWQVQHY